MNMMAVMANSGFLVRPHIVRKVGDTYMQTDKPKNIGLRDGTINVIREGLRQVVNNEDGTGKHAKLEGVLVAGKTGTAENAHGRTHAWFAGFAPFDDPKICVVVFLEHGGKGGLGAADIARGVFDEARKKGYL
jgi:cell division protein FtsI/penicillin-binding protein 2